MENWNKRRNLEICLKEAIKAARNAIGEENVENIGIYDDANENSKIALNQVLTKSDQGIEVRRIDLMNEDGELEEVEDPRREVNNLLKQGHARKQKHIKNEKFEVEHRKNLQSVEKADLVSVKIPDLVIEAGRNNICD